MSDNEIKHAIISIKQQPTIFGFAIKSNCLVQIFVQVNCASKILHSPIMHTDLAMVKEIADKCTEFQTVHQNTTKKAIPV